MSRILVGSELPERNEQTLNRAGCSPSASASGHADLIKKKENENRPDPANLYWILELSPSIQEGVAT